MIYVEINFDLTFVAIETSLYSESLRFHTSVMDLTVIAKPADGSVLAESVNTQLLGVTDRFCAVSCYSPDVIFNDAT